MPETGVANLAVGVESGRHLGRCTEVGEDLGNRPTFARRGGEVGAEIGRQPLPFVGGGKHLVQDSLDVALDGLHDSSSGGAAPVKMS